MAVKDVEEEPVVSLTRWTIIRTADRGEFHFVGFKSDGKARVSSALSDFCMTGMTGRTSSGRQYTLGGDPELNPLTARLIVAKAWGANLVGLVTPVDPALAAAMSPAIGRA